MRKYLLASICVAALCAPAHSQIVSNGAGGSGSGCTIANPTAIASDVAVNGVATTCMASDSAPAVQKGTAAQFGVVQVDGTTITATGGIISSIGGTGNALFGTTTGNTTNDFVSMSNTTVGVKDSTFSSASFAPAGLVFRDATTPTITVAQWAAFATHIITGASLTATLPASSTLSNNGGMDFVTEANAATLTANAADTITFAGSTTGTGGSITLSPNTAYSAYTDAAGKIIVSGRNVQGNGALVQLSTGSTTTNDCVKFDANGNTVDSGGACGGSGSPGGSNTQFQYNNSSAFGGISTLVYNGSTVTNSFSGAASAPAELFTGTPFAGNATTSFGLVDIDWGATHPTTLPTTGTAIEVNAASGFPGNLLGLYTNGTAEFTVSGSGGVTTGSLVLAAAGNIKFGSLAQITMPSTAIISLKNNAGTGTALVAIGNNTSSFPALVADPSTTTTLDVVLANSSVASPTLTGLSSAALTASGAVTFSGVTTGTNADFACFAAGGVMTLQSTACTISSLRFKTDVGSYSRELLPTLISLDVDTFKYKAINQDPNGNVEQLGLIAEDIAKKLPICAVYESDMKTPKSYKQECVIAALVKGLREQQAEIDELRGHSLQASTGWHGFFASVEHALGLA